MECGPDSGALPPYSTLRPIQGLIQTSSLSSPPPPPPLQELLELDQSVGYYTAAGGIPAHLTFGGSR